MYTPLFATGSRVAWLSWFYKENHRSKTNRVWIIPLLIINLNPLWLITGYADININNRIHCPLIIVLFTRHWQPTIAIYRSKNSCYFCPLVSILVHLSLSFVSLVSAIMQIYKTNIILKGKSLHLMKTFNQEWLELCQGYFICASLACIKKARKTSQIIMILCHEKIYF